MKSGYIICQSSPQRYFPGKQVKAKYYTYVPPNMSLWHNDTEINDSIWFELGQNLLIECRAIGSKPRVSLTWLLNENSIMPTMATMPTMPTTLNGTQLFNSSSTLTYTGDGDENITCEAKFEDDQQPQWEKSVFVIPYVRPNISITINNETITEYTKGTDVNISCQASGADPNARVTLFIDGEPYGNLVIEHKLSLEKTYYLNCTTWQEGPDITTWKSEIINVTDPTTAAAETTSSGQNTTSQSGDENADNIMHYYLLSGAAALSAFLILWGFVKLGKKVVASNRLSLQSEQRQPGYMRPTPLALITRELPPIYDQTPESVITDEIENNVEDILTGLTSDDVELNFQLPGAGTMKYWVATYSSNDEKKKIIAKSVSECARMKEILNFRALAKNATIMPKHQNIVEVLGVSLEDVPYFIYQEYIEYGSLKDFLMRNYQESSGSFNKEETPNNEKTIHLTMFAVDICQGMLFLTHQNCRHPGMSARKVLLSPKGKCKLYDFWPVDLVQDRVKQILEKKLPPLAWLAPETVFLGHYMEKSDIWNFGVILWEIYSLGEIPFGGLTCTEIETKLRNKEYLDQPLTCPGGIFGSMLSTWNSAIDERPTFDSLHITLNSFLNDMKKTFEEEANHSEQPNYFSLDKDSSDSSDDYIEHII